MPVTNKCVLIVDDDPLIAEVAEFALVSRGFEVVIAADGLEGLAQAERHRPGVILLDVVMPRRSGWTLLERIRQWQPPAPRIILMTGNDEPRHREFAAAHGADAFFAKPFDVEALVACVEELTGRSSEE